MNFDPGAYYLSFACFIIGRLAIARLKKKLGLVSASTIFLVLRL